MSKGIYMCELSYLDEIHKFAGNHKIRPSAIGVALFHEEVNHGLVAVQYKNRVP